MNGILSTEQLDGAGGLHGRIKIEYNQDITLNNVVQMVKNTLPTHYENVEAMQYLYRMYRGRIDSVMSRRIGEDIRNIAIVNYANMITNFKRNYFLSDPISVVNAGETDLSTEVSELNKIYKMCGKHSHDKTIAENFIICGQSYRFVSVNPKYERGSREESPILLTSVSPQRAYMVHSTGITEEVIGAVIITPKAYLFNEQQFDIISVYTDREYFEVANGQVIKHEINTLGLIPLIEFRNNDKRLGAFEIVHTLIEEASLLTSMRLDGYQNEVDAYLIGENVNITEEQLKESKRNRFIQYQTTKENPAKLDYISAKTNQTDVDVLFRSIRDTIFELTSLPNSSNNITSLGNNGASLITGGFYQADIAEVSTEEMVKYCETQTLKLVLRICEGFGLLKELTPYDVDYVFTRRTYLDLQTKAQSLKMLLPQEFEVSPELAFEASGLFVDSATAFNKSLDYTNKYKQETEQQGQDIQSIETQTEKSIIAQI